ncbi:hypothetical protein SAMD00019534_071800 [Acytostelium subglobosum LB1]|uniref:hypothetical protein n=1 Tax=Acytostelium subglobosum LB1 TaxID=1410327 RepID=UPI000644C8F3|nr:hypothetical protein SAMD00019534_071800 [Acytostelium subglobosum LB1]GAM24005.1 hypothetical protein SAMD00019534_071800 [Acytostelium subglobosum LB1]|eukprot:XP_012753041.1 hypothetical protein SAMD00019534_071800 [Acytostelium subglobosum LB1]
MNTNPKKMKELEDSQHQQISKKKQAGEYKEPSGRRGLSDITNQFTNLNIHS